MRVLTVRQPWAWAIIHGGKDVENRVRNIAGDYRGPVAIHAAISATATLTAADERLLLDHDADGKVDAWLGGDPIEGGVILGVVDLVGVHRPTVTEAGVLLDAVDPEGRCEHVVVGQTCSRWAQPDAHHLVLSHPRPLPTAIPFKGALGLRILPADVEAQIRAVLS